MLHFRDIEADTKNITTIAVFSDNVINWFNIRQIVVQTILREALYRERGPRWSSLLSPLHRLHHKSYVVADRDNLSNLPSILSGLER